jgi:hypothetical protein
LNSGQHLIVKPGGEKNRGILCLAGANKNKEYSDEYLRATLFTLESQSVDPDERLKTSIVVKIKHVETNFYISTSSSIERPRTVVSQNPNIEEEKFVKDFVDRKDTRSFKLNTRSTLEADIAKHNLECSLKSKDEDAFIIELTTKEYIRDCMTIHAAIPMLKEYVWDIRMKREEKMRNKDRMKKIENILTELIFFVTETEDSDPFTCEGIPYKERQKILRELKVVEIL